MNNKHTFLFTVLQFFLVTALSLIISFLWMYLADSWDLLGDGIHYMVLYNEQVANSPFGYRILTPFLARLLPWDALTNFTVISLSCLSLTTGVFVLYFSKFNISKLSTIFLLFFWTTSFPFIYYGTTFIRADAPMLLVIAATILLSQHRVPPFILLTLFAAGTLFHEMVMIVIPALWLDKYFTGSLTGGSKYSYRELLLITLGTILFYIVSRLTIPTNPSEVLHYLNVQSPIEMINHVLIYSEGFINHILRIYASFGPMFLYSLAYVLFIRKQYSDTMVYLILLLITVVATFLATDTLRVMAIISFAVIIYASHFLLKTWEKGHRVITIVLLLLQVVYTSVVYLNLRTFELSLEWNIVAAVISIVTLLLCFWEIKRPISNNEV
ncbi:MAG: hypothetical protein V3U71_02405 [Cocleimonas sp.]